MADRPIDDLLAGLPDAVRPSAEFEARLRARLREELSVRRSEHVTNPTGLPTEEVIELQTLPPPTRSSGMSGGNRSRWLVVAAAGIALVGLAAIALTVIDAPESPASEVPVATTVAPSATTATTARTTTTTPPTTTSPATTTTSAETTVDEAPIAPPASGFAAAAVDTFPIELERNPYFVAVGTTPWVASLGGDLARLDPATGEIVETMTISESSPMVADQNGLWVADALTGEVHRLDPETGVLMATIPTGLPIIPNSFRFPMLEGAARPFASIGGIGTDGASVWVGDHGGVVMRIDPATDTVVQRFEVPVRPDHVRSDGHYVLVASPRRGEVAVLDASGAVVLTETYPEAVAGAELFGGALYVQDASDGTVTRVELAEGTETRSEPLGASVVRNQEPTLPTGLVVTEDGLLAATANEPNGLHVLDPVTLAEIGTLEIPPDQGDLTIGADGSAWIVRTRENTVVRIIPSSAAS